MWIVEFGLRMWPGRPIYVTLLMDSEVDSEAAPAPCGFAANLFLHASMLLSMRSLALSLVPNHIVKIR